MTVTSQFVDTKMLATERFLLIRVALLKAIEAGLKTLQI